MKYAFLKEARDAYLRGENITEFLKHQLGSTLNTREIIEIAYDLQAGSYVRYAIEQKDQLEKYCNEIAGIIDNYVKPGDRVLDIGTGELTTLSYVANKLTARKVELLAFDISWSRLFYGRQFCYQHLRLPLRKAICIFCAELLKIPLLSRSVDVVISAHALEPNGGKEESLLKEVFRVARRKVILCEPNYEQNSKEGRMRMDHLGYIRGLPKAIKRMGGRLTDSLPIKNNLNILNPTMAYIIDPPDVVGSSSKEVFGADIFSDPGTNSPLQRHPDCFFSPLLGVSYPIIQEIPVLRSDTAILTTAKLASSGCNNNKMD